MELNAHMHVNITNISHDVTSPDHDHNKVVADMAMEFQKDDYSTSGAVFDDMKSIFSIFMGQAEEMGS